MADNKIVVKKQWFIKSMTGKVDDYYQAASKKVEIMIWVWEWKGEKSMEKRGGSEKNKTTNTTILLLL